MAPRNPSDAALLASFGKLGTAPAPSPVDRKKAAVSQASRAKQVLYSGEEALNTAATAVRQGNDMGQSEVLQDLENLTYGELRRKYGQEVADQSYRYSQARQQMDQLKGAERTTKGMLGDAGWDLAQMGTALLGGGVELGIAASDYVVGRPLDEISKAAGLGSTIDPLAPKFSEQLNAFTGWMGDQKSDLFKERQDQHMLEAMLNEKDAQARYDADLAESQSWTDRVEAWTKFQGQNALDVLENYSDDGMMVGSLAAQGNSRDPRNERGGAHGERAVCSAPEGRPGPRKSPGADRFRSGPDHGYYRDYGSHRSRASGCALRRQPACNPVHPSRRQRRGNGSRTQHRRRDDGGRASERPVQPGRRHRHEYWRLRPRGWRHLGSGSGRRRFGRRSDRRHASSSRRYAGSHGRKRPGYRPGHWRRHRTTCRQDRRGTRSRVRYWIPIPSRKF